MRISVLMVRIRHIEPRGGSLALIRLQNPFPGKRATSILQLPGTRTPDNITFPNNNIILVFIFFFQGIFRDQLFAVVFYASYVGLATLSVSRIKTPKLFGNPITQSPNHPIIDPIRYTDNPAQKRATQCRLQNHSLPVK